MIGVIVFLTVLFICATILIGMYIYYCAENGTGVFEILRYSERIENLEKQVNELKGK